MSQGPGLSSLGKIGKKARRFWSKEASLKARLVNIGHLLTGNLFGSLIGVLGFMITARALGPTDYGILALTYSYVRIVERLVGFQSWQPLIKYGAELRGEEHVDDYRSLLKFGLMVDVSAALASFLVAITVALLLGPLVGVGEEALSYVLVYSSVLLFQISGLPTAVMRLAGRFRLIAYGGVGNGALRVVLCGIGLLTGADLMYFVVVWAVTQITGSLTLLTLAFLELRRQKVRRILSASLAGVTARFKGLVGFTIGGNVELTVRSSANEFDTLIVGALSDPASAGLYHIAKRLARLILQLGVQVQAVLYPDAARLWAQNAIKEFKRAILQMEVMLGAFGLLCIAGTFVAIGPFLRLTAGPEFEAAAGLATVQMIAVALNLSGSAMRTAMLAMGLQPTVLKIVLAATACFHVTALALVPQMGPMGANIAHVVMASVWFVSLTIAFRAALRRPRDAVPAVTKDAPRDLGDMG